MRGCPIGGGCACWQGSGKGGRREAEVGERMPAPGGAVFPGAEHVVHCGAEPVELVRDREGTLKDPGADGEGERRRIDGWMDGQTVRRTDR